MENEIRAEKLCERLPGLGADATNTENRFQGNLRYGMMDVNLLAERIRKDFERCPSSSGNRYRSSVMVTHLNEYAGVDTESLARQFGTLYLSDGRTSGDIHIF